LEDAPGIGVDVPETARGPCHGYAGAHGRRANWNRRSARLGRICAEKRGRQGENHEWAHDERSQSKHVNVSPDLKMSGRAPMTSGYTQHSAVRIGISHRKLPRMDEAAALFISCSSSFPYGLRKSF
jgi:hypothetical protein